MKIQVFGEILWDLFENERRIGGAPLNFSAHSARLGAEVSIISAVGKEALGDESIAVARSYGIDTSFVHRSERETGCCIVSLKGEMPSYELVKDKAYDAIPFPENAPLTADAFYFGTLAQRGKVSEETLQRLLREGLYREIFFDINIRQHYYTPEQIRRSLAACTILKISEEEIGVLGELGIAGGSEEIARTLGERYPNLRIVLITLGGEGSLLYRPAEGKLLHSPKPSSKPLSTVGAGDSFSAAFLCSHLAGESDEKALKRATTLSDYVVTRLEAVPELPGELLPEVSAIKK